MNHGCTGGSGNGLLRHVGKGGDGRGQRGGSQSGPSQGHGEEEDGRQTELVRALFAHGNVAPSVREEGTRGERENRQRRGAQSKNDALDATTASRARASAKSNAVTT